MKKLLSAVLVTTFASSALAVDSKQIESAKASITEKQKELAELKNSIGNARRVGDKALVKFSIHLTKSLIVSAGTVWYINEYRKTGNLPFQGLTRLFEKMDPNAGLFFGSVPRTAFKAVGYYGSKVAGISALVAGTVWSVIEAVDAVEDGYVMTIEYSKIALMETQIQVAQEELTTALAQVSAVEQSLK